MAVIFFYWEKARFLADGEGNFNKPCFQNVICIIADITDYAFTKQVSKYTIANVVHAPWQTDEGVQKSIFAKWKRTKLVRNKMLCSFFTEKLQKAEMRESFQCWQHGLTKKKSILQANISYCILILQQSYRHMYKTYF